MNRSLSVAREAKAREAKSAGESAHDWRDLLLDLRLTIADGVFGFWEAAGEVSPKILSTSDIE